ncbi:MAG TPA: ThuA domain-containing protein [Chloroflexota bacterium]|nr:ThuA domain-containing protein [Chloroflexota bacterium]
MKKALIVQGDCPCHPSRAIADILAEQLQAAEFEVSMAHSMDCFLDRARLAETDLLVMNWHMATITHQQLAPFLDAVRDGTGLAGIHGYMGDTLRTTPIFRNEHAYEWMIGGQWVSHPGDDGVTYTVRIVDARSPITAGIDDFTVSTEKYYMHFDPAIHPVAVTDFDEIVMPIAWTKGYGRGRIFYHSLGHRPNIVQIPEVLRLTRQGMAWAAR